MTKKYEYKFVRLGKGWMSVKKEALREYQAAIKLHASQGWRLLQIFAPGVGAYGAAKYFDLIFEREVESS